ncbi:aminoglycoside phosphotransferase family protein [Streptomyces sp. NBC_01754]|uniref:phosphotransferase n=1 Tax=Streptomyces sp. NBC_01754 TaxID=2975930 RepID=UPI002DDC2931|nr:phosphotransferase [Streptomyces sp. NBC_01754]WSC91523.1 aminoglycoside phosphotransferase family protein [Streptomyces sp. NBC_01754]
MTTTPFVHALGALAHQGAHVHAPAGVCRCAPPGVLADRPDGTVVRSGPVVAKAHAPDADVPALTARLALAASPRLAGILLPPLAEPATTAGSAGARTVEGRVVTLWPHGLPVDPADPDAAPWEEAAVLLARLHRTRPPHPLPPMRGPAKAARAVARMRAARPRTPAPTAPTGTGPDTAPGSTTDPCSAAAPVLAAWRRLPGWARGEAPVPVHRAGHLCHGDLHLGQLVRYPVPDGPWLLIDVDDAGLGDPAWDLARPAAWYAAGLLAPEVWLRFLDAYRTEGGPAVHPEEDPWPELDVPARALTVQTAALAVARSVAEDRNPDEVEQLVIDACARIACLPAELGAVPTS